MKSNFKPPQYDRKKVEKELFEAFTILDNSDSIGLFLKDLCTPAELQALVDRWHVVKLLKKDIPYRKIHELTGVSVTTIGRVARFLSSGFGGYELVLKNNNKD